jgi:NTE family protein
MNERSVGLALSGGGFRAAAFHLGCLRALHDRDLLRRVRVVSGVSGGALMAALWAYGPESFADFNACAVEMLRGGLHLKILQEVLRPSKIAHNVGATILNGARRLTAPNSPPVMHRSTRTDGLAACLARLAFGDAVMPEVTQPGADIVLTATDLRSGGAVRFGSAVSACSRYGAITEPVPVATAVAASAAYPLYLPAMERRFTFDRAGSQRVQTLLLADGGIYDNLGLSVLEPGRSSSYTSHVYDVRYIISCDAGRGAGDLSNPRTLISRLQRSFDITHRRAQDSGRARLHEWKANGQLEGFVLAYLGMPDHRIPTPLADLVSRDSVASYGTNFAAMATVDLQLLATRGEQLVRTLLPAYCANLL